VQRDSQLRVTHPGEAATESEKAAWRVKAEEYIAEEAPEDGTARGARKRQKPPERIASYDHAVCEDSQLRSAGLDGLASYVPKEGDGQKKLLEKPILVRISDQASPCEGTKWFPALRHMGLAFQR
jgi:hypothetical protein